MKKTLSGVREGFFAKFPPTTDLNGRCSLYAFVHEDQLCTGYAPMWKLRKSNTQQQLVMSWSFTFVADIWLRHEVNKKKLHMSAATLDQANEPLVPTCSIN
jgi:hypothetical protein